MIMHITIGVTMVIIPILITAIHPSILILHSIITGAIITTGTVTTTLIAQE